MKQILNKLFAHQALSKAEAADVMSKIAQGAYNNEQISAFISVFMMRSIELDELIGFREALLNTALLIDLSQYNPIDIVGTGGDGKNTFNISTLSGFVVAGAGYKVAKHGNYGATSISGASNVLEHLGAKFTNDADIIQKSLDDSGFAFLHAPLFNPAMKNVVGIRKNLGFRTFFNVLGPIINPAQPKFNLLGTYDLRMIRLYSYIYQNLDAAFTIVHALDGFDEISLTGRSKITNNRGEYVYEPSDLNFRKLEIEELSGGETVADAAEIFTNVLNNQATEAQTNVVLINAALAIQTLEPNKTIEECVAISKESIESGKAKLAFTKFLKHYSA